MVDTAVADSPQGMIQQARKMLSDQGAPMNAENLNRAMQMIHGTRTDGTDFDSMVEQRGNPTARPPRSANRSRAPAAGSGDDLPTPPPQPPPPSQAQARSPIPLDTEVSAAAPSPEEVNEATVGVGAPDTGYRVAQNPAILDRISAMVGLGGSTPAAATTPPQGPAEAPALDANGNANEALLGQLGDQHINPSISPLDALGMGRTLLSLGGRGVGELGVSLSPRGGPAIANAARGGRVVDPYSTAYRMHPEPGPNIIPGPARIPGSPGAPQVGGPPQGVQIGNTGASALPPPAPRLAAPPPPARPTGANPPNVIPMQGGPSQAHRMPGRLADPRLEVQRRVADMLARRRAAGGQ